MNEISLLFFGQPEKLNSALLLNLNIIEFRKETEKYSGLYILENKFGKEIIKKLSLDFTTDESDWLVYRYLSDDDLLQLRSVGAGRKVFVLLQNYMTVDYFKAHVPANNLSYQYIVGQNDQIKSMTSVAGQVSDKNVVFVKNVKPASKVNAEASHNVPEFLAVLLKLLLNPVDEVNTVSRNLMHSNQRVLYRFIELLNFIHFVLYRGIGLQVFWKSIVTIGVVKVAIIKTKFFLRHLFLMEFYKAWGLIVDSAHFLIRTKDKIILTVYYRTLHRIFYRVFHRAAHGVWLSYINPVYFKVLRPAVIGLYSWIEEKIYYQGIHRFVFAGLRYAGYFWQHFLSPIYYATVHRFIYQFLIGLLFYKMLSPAFSFIYYGIIHRFLHRVLMPGLNFIYYGLIHRFLHKVLKPVIGFIYYGLIHRAVHQVLKPALSYIFYRVIQRFYYQVIQAFFYSFIHRGYHKIIVPVLSFLFYRGFALLYHRGIRPVYSYLWYDITVRKIYYQGIFKFYYQGILKFYYQVILKFYYQGLLKIYYAVKILLFYRLWPWVKFNIFIRFHHFVIYKIRHYFLMGIFKSYGLGYDLLMLIFRVTKLYLLYPVFKIYWFTSFQYNKRIKKYFA